MRRFATAPVAALVAAALAAATAVFTALPAAAKVSPPSADGHWVKTSPYVALGDSYSAAAGVQPVIDAVCQRSSRNYAHRIAARTGARRFTDVTCSGAKTTDFFASQHPGVTPPQLDAVTKDTRLVTMTIGGNDGDVFTTMLTTCYVASVTSGNVTGSPCRQKAGSAFAGTIATVTYPGLVRALAAVRAKAPRATVVILGYPRLLPDVGDPDCYASMPFSMGDVPYMMGVEKTLNRAAEKAAARTGARYVDMFPASKGRDGCAPADRRWLEPLVGPVGAAPVHPNAAGEAGMAWQTLAQLRILSRRH